jgi:hypothetical protein
LNDNLGSPLGGLTLEPLQQGLYCDGLNFHNLILPQFDPMAQIGVFGSAVEKRRIELSPPFKEDFSYS